HSDSGPLPLEGGGLGWGCSPPDPLFPPSRSHACSRPVMISIGRPSMSLDVYRELTESLRARQPRVLATVSSTRGSTPRKAGASMLLRPDGTFLGTIGGGCGEAEVWQEAMETMRDGKPRTVIVDLTEPVEGEDKICGGIMHVFVERVSGQA